MMLWSAFGAIILGLFLLVWSADRFVAGAAALARGLGVSPLLVGLTIVALGTSAPEIFVAVVASLKNNGALAIGNAIGSNIANVGLVIGVTVLIKPLVVSSTMLRREFPILFLIMAIVGVIFWDGFFSRLEGIFLLLGMVALVGYLIYLGRQQCHGDEVDSLVAEFTVELPVSMPIKWAVIWVLLGLILLPMSAEIFVHGASTVAHIFGVSDLVIGLTIVAIGTSLPELFASLMGALKGEDDIAMGNVLGSNMFNLLVVLGLPGLIDPGVLPRAAMYRDYPVMVILTIFLFTASFLKKWPAKITRWEGVLLLIMYLGYLIMLGYTPMST